MRKAKKEDMMIEYRHTVTCWENVKARSAWKKTRFNLPKLKMPTFDKATRRPHMKDFMAGGGGWKENKQEDESSGGDSEDE